MTTETKNEDNKDAVAARDGQGAGPAGGDASPDRARAAIARLSESRSQGSRAERIAAMRQRAAGQTAPPAPPVTASAQPASSPVPAAEAASAATPAAPPAPPAPTPAPAPAPGPVAVDPAVSKVGEHVPLDPDGKIGPTAVPRVPPIRALIGDALLTLTVERATATDRDTVERLAAGHVLNHQLAGTLADGTMIIIIPPPAKG